MVYKLGEWEKPALEELTHYGVPGMKWGKHKREEPVEIVKARKAVEERKGDLKRARRKETRAFYLDTTAAYTQALKDLTRAEKEHQYSKEDLASAKILNRLKAKPKSEKQFALEEKYKKKGMGDDEAAVAAYKNIRTKKILAVVGTVAVVSLTAYAAYKFHDARIDKIIKSGTLLQNISPDANKGIRDAFYSSGNKLDNVKYQGLYGRQLKDVGGGAFKKEIKVLSDIKQASHKSAQSTLSELIKTDPEFAKGVKEYVVDNNKLGGGYFRKTIAAGKSLDNGKVNKDVYELFNASLVDHDPQMQSLTNKFYNALSNKGYNAVKDINDSKYSGYKALNPIIAFNTKGKVDVISVKELANDEINKAAKLGYAHIIGSNLVKTGSMYAAGYFAIKTSSAASVKKANNTAINKYRKEHPGTQMTNTEIARMIERSKIK